MEEKSLAFQAIVSKLASARIGEKKEAVCELRVLAKLNDENRIAIAELGAIPLLLKLVYSSNCEVQENAVTALLNLSINDVNKASIMQSASSFLDTASYALRMGHTMETKENCAALLFSIMICEDYRPIIGRNEEIVASLLNLLRNGSCRGQRDALKALFHLAVCAENRLHLVSGGAIHVLLSAIRRRASGVFVDCLAVLAQIALCTASIHVFENTISIPLIMDILNGGVSMAQENAASVLLNLCKSGGTPVIERIPINSCIDSLSLLISSGSPRARRKASALLQILVTGGDFEAADSCLPGEKSTTMYSDPFFTA